ncbi:MAG TPA: DUF3422 domain-containing protein [Usitatibacteraceae bacterium]|nr:DUF3422 domain-containing protein [Usitatibacteraceae bacterium]
MGHPNFILPEDDLRSALNDEVHSRPPVRLAGAQHIVYLAVRHDPAERAAHRQALATIAQSAGAAVAPQVDHAVVTLAEGLRFKWEGHAEFSSYTFFAEGAGERVPAAVLESAGWPEIAATLPGEVLVAVSIDLVPFQGDSPPTNAFHTQSDTIVGGAVAEGRGWGYTDFRIREDGFTRFLLLNREMGLGQAGRMVQRLLEIETYRMMALLAFPVARKAAPDLGAMETELAAIVGRIAGATPQDEARLLDDLTRLAARVEHLLSATRFRFEAADAYDALVSRRLAELREVRIPGLSTIEEFLHRRLAPAMATCRSASRRIGNLASRVTRASALLRTRVDIAREQQNQKVLEAMNRRGRVQLRLQQTVEGLSVVVITYYGVSLVGVLAKAAKAAGVDWNPEVVMGIAVPFVAALVFGGVRRVRKALEGEEKGGA